MRCRVIFSTLLGDPVFFLENDVETVPRKGDIIDWRHETHVAYGEVCRVTHLHGLIEALVEVPPWILHPAQESTEKDAREAKK